MRVYLFIFSIFHFFPAAVERRGRGGERMDRVRESGRARERDFARVVVVVFVRAKIAGGGPKPREDRPWRVSSSRPRLGLPRTAKLIIAGNTARSCSEGSPV